MFTSSELCSYFNEQRGVRGPVVLVKGGLQHPLSLAASSGETMIPLKPEYIDPQFTCKVFWGVSILARINIENSLYKDIRFDELTTKLGGDREKAIGALVRAWSLAQDHYLTTVNDRLIPLNEWQRQKINPAIIEVGFAEIREKGIYVCGSEEQFAWLLQKSNAGRRSAELKAQRSSTPVESRSTHVNGSQPPTLPLPPSQILNTESRVLDSSPPPKKASAKATYSIDESSDFMKFLEEYLTGWVQLYNAEYINREVAKAILWLKANPGKNKKTIRGWVAFFGGWFDRGWSQHTKSLETNKIHSEQKKQRYYYG